MQSGEDSDWLQELPSHEDGGKGGELVASTMSGGDDADSADHPRTQPALRDVDIKHSTWSRKRVSHKDEPIESDMPRRRPTDGDGIPSRGATTVVEECSENNVEHAVVVTPGNVC